MRTRLFVCRALLTLLLVGAIASPLVAQSVVCLEKRQDLLVVSKVHGVNASYIVQSCPVDPLMFVHAKDCDGRLLQYPDAVHEALHVLNATKQGWNFSKVRSRSYFATPDSFLLARIPPNLPYSTIIVDDVPGWMKVNGSRFTTYITDTVQDASKNGLFGLAEEFTAYAITVESYCNLMMYASEYDPGWLHDHFPELYARGNDAVLAYYEFQLFQVLYMARLQALDTSLYETVAKSGITPILHRFDIAFVESIQRWNDLTTKYIACSQDLEQKEDYLKLRGVASSWQTRVKDLERAREVLSRTLNCSSFYRPLLIERTP